MPSRNSHEIHTKQCPKETLKNLAGGLASGRIYPSGGTVGRGDAAARELFPGGIRREEKADSSGQVFGRDGAGGAVDAAGGSSAAILPEGRAGPAADRAGADAAALLFAAVVWAGRRGSGGRPVR